MNRYNTFDESSHDSGGDENDIDRCACDLFDIMDEDNKGSITEDQFKKLLLTIGLTDEEGQSAAVAGEMPKQLDLKIARPMLEKQY